MDLLITGAAGFLGSHILFKWLCHYPNARALCLVRGAAGETPRERVRGALAQAVHECDAAAALPALMARVTVLPADLADPAWRDDPALAAWVAAGTGFEVLHGAANLSFREEDRDVVWQTNVGASVKLFNALAGLPGLRHFNYVSTAYVAGNQEGSIPERLYPRPRQFNNVYEESKWEAEQALTALAARRGLGLRIFRPSIIIGHSTTYRIAARTGFYKVVETLMTLGRTRAAQSQAIRVAVNRNAAMNLIPVDVVTAELVDIVAAGERSAGRVYHLTNDRPLSLADLFLGVSPLTGVRLLCGAEHERPAGQLAGVVARGLRHYMPYFRYSREFERDNVRALGAGRHQADYWLDLTRVREFVQAFIDEEQRQLARAEEVPA